MSNELLSRVRAGVVRVGEGFGMVIKVRTNLLIRNAEGNPVGIDPDRDGPTHEVVTTVYCLPAYHEHDDDDPESLAIGPLDQPTPTIEGERHVDLPRAGDGATLPEAASVDEDAKCNVAGMLLVNAEGRAVALSRPCAPMRPI